MSQKIESRHERDAVSLGETMLLFQAEEYGALRHNERFRKFIGGTESNTMMALARLGFSASWISRLGADEFGCNIRDFIRGQGVDTSGVIFDREAPTGVFFVEKNANDETRSFYYRAGSAASRMNFKDLDLDFIGRHRLLHLTGITPVLSPSCAELTARLISEAKARGMTVSLDPNLRLTVAPAERFRELIRPLLSRVDIFLPGEGELLLLTGARELEEAIGWVQEAGAGRMAIKLGARGGLLVKGKERISEPPFPVKRIVSSMGAGDAFNAGILAAELKGRPEREGLKLGNCLGALVSLAWGPYEGLPDWETVRAYLGGEGVVER
jgi:2-dehydro-3-deoxygluconokinase